MPFRLHRPGFLSRPPFTRPSRLMWAAAEAGRVRDRLSRRGERAAHAVEDAAHEVADKAGRALGDRRDRLRAAAREALASSRFGPSARRRSAPASKGWRLFKRKAAGAPPKLGVVEASALFVLAGLILVAPRDGRPSALSSLIDGQRAPGQGEDAGAERRDPGRGRAATSPWRIPPRGWKDILLRTWSEFNEDQIAAVAGGVTFFGLLAMFPALAAFVSLYGLFADVANAREQLRLFAGFLPHDVLKFVGDEMVRIAGGEHGSLGVAFGVSLLISLWSANGAVKALFHGLNVAYEERERRNLVELNLISLAFTLGAIVFAILAVSAVIVAPVALSFVGLNAGAAWLAVLRWPVMLVVLVLGLSAVYRYGPSRQHARWRWISVGGVVAAVLWVAASLLFSWYVANFAHYDRTYGSLGAVIGFMFWLWYTTIIVLFGAELNAELEHQTAVDTTTGPPLPMGARGAKMADTLPPRPARKAS